MERLIVRNFGAIRDVEIELKPLTIFIGENGTGKSTLSKLISIFRDSEFWSGENSSNADSFYLCLLSNQISDFLKRDTYIEYQSKFGVSIIYQHEQLTTNYSKDFLSSLKDQAGKHIQSDLETCKNKTANLFNQSLYIPSNREVLSFLSEKFSTSYKEKLIEVFPKSSKDFIQYFNQISSGLNGYFVNLFDVTYRKICGKDYIEFKDGQHLLLSNAASGMQTAIPMILVLESFSNSEQKKNFVIEEPEHNLFPSAQKALVEFFAEKVLNNGHELVITTNSPYILTSLNNLLFAEQVGKTKSQVEDVIPKRFWIDSQDVVSYLVQNGITTSIIDHELQQICAEDIDYTSQNLNSVYDHLLDIQIENT